MENILPIPHNNQLSMVLGNPIYPTMVKSEDEKNASSTKRRMIQQQ